MNKQMMKKINSPKMFFTFILFVAIALIIIYFIFKAIRVIFDMDKKADTNMYNSKLAANDKIYNPDTNPNTNTNPSTNTNPNTNTNPSNNNNNTNKNT